MRTLATILVLALPIGAAPAGDGEHPRLFFSKRTLPALRAKIAREPFQSRWSRLLQNADHFLTEPVKGLKEVRPAQGISILCAMAYAVTGKKAYAERAKREALALLAEPKWHTVRGWNKGVDLETAEASASCALVYDWCHDALTSEERARFREGVLNKSTKIYLQSVEQHKDWWVENPVTNWCGVCNGGAGLAALAFHDEGPEFRKAADHARRLVPKFLRSVVLEDGDGHEGIMYHRYGVTFGYLFLTADAAISGGKVEALAEDARKLAGYWDVYLQAPDGRYANFNDMNEETFAGLYSKTPNQYEAGPCADLCALWESAHPQGDPLLLWGADNGGSAFFYRGTSPFWFLWRRDAPPAGSRKPPLRDAVLFRGSGHALIQSPDLWFCYNGGWTSNKSHANQDLGTFVLVAGGERLVHDAGYGATKTGDHSTIVVDGRDQPKDVRGTYVRFGSGKGFHYFASDLSAAYPGMLRKFVRHAVVVKGRYVVLLDEVEAPEPADLEWRLQTRRPIRLNGKAAAIAGEKTVLHVIPAATGSVLGQGKATIEFVSQRPPARAAAWTFVTVLAPGAAPAKVAWDRKGKLEVGEDVIGFGKSEAGWILSSVNGASASSLGSGRERSLAAVR